MNPDCSCMTLPYSCIIQSQDIEWKVKSCLPLQQKYFEISMEHNFSDIITLGSSLMTSSSIMIGPYRTGATGKFCRFLYL